MAKVRQKRLARLEAAQLLCEIQPKGHSLYEVWPDFKQRYVGNERPLIQQLVYGCLRHYHYLVAVRDGLWSKPLKAKDAVLDWLLLLGLYQLEFLSIEDHTVVDEIVKAAKASPKRWGANLLNGTLRRFLREREGLLAKITPEAKLSHPTWWRKQLEQEWPNEAQAMMEANNTQGPMHLRVNTRRTSVDPLAKRWQGQGIEVIQHPNFPQALTLKQACDVHQLPGFAEGDCSVQDLSAQCAAQVLGDVKGLRVLDACSAPGGKLAHVLELNPEIGECWALELAPHRIKPIHENLARLKLQAKVVCGDVAEPSDWWDHKKFDRILLDVPCSATGVVRRHPDIKLLRREEDISSFAAEQLQLLTVAAHQLLAAGGMILYATCSVMREENDGVLGAFLADNLSFLSQSISFSQGQATEYGWQLLPEKDGGDGLYYAIIAARCP